MSNARPTGDHHVENQGGRGGSFTPIKKDAFPDIPAHVKELWDKFKTTDADRVIEAKYYRENKAKRT